MSTWWLNLPFETRLMIVLFVCSLVSCVAGLVVGMWWRK